MTASHRSSPIAALTETPTLPPRSPSYPWAAGTPTPEVAESIAALQGRWTTAILSNADDDYLLPQLKRIGLTFPVVLSSEMIGAYKPHPLPFRRVLKALDLEPGEAVYVGDNPLRRRVGSQGRRHERHLDQPQRQDPRQSTTPARFPGVQPRPAALNPGELGLR